jgi:hypothetical protein
MKSSSNYHKFLLLWSGELVSAIGSGLTSFGLGVYVFNLTGSAASILYILDGEIRGERKLGRYTKDIRAEREQQTADWLSSLGW